MENTTNLQRMDGLIEEGGAKEALTKLARSIIRDLKIEGFDSDDIYQYICSLVQEAGN